MYLVRTVQFCCEVGCHFIQQAKQANLDIHPFHHQRSWLYFVLLKCITRVGSGIFRKWKRTSHSQGLFQFRAPSTILLQTSIYCLHFLRNSWSATDWIQQSKFRGLRQLFTCTCKCIIVVFNVCFFISRIITRLHSREFRWRSMHSENLFRESTVSENKTL